MALFLPDRALGKWQLVISRAQPMLAFNFFSFSCTVSSNTCFTISFIGMVENWDSLTVAGLPQDLMDGHCLNGK